jgi:hypothetical protein
MASALSADMLSPLPLEPPGLLYLRCHDPDASEISISAPERVQREQRGLRPDGRLVSAAEENKRWNKRI